MDYSVDVRALDRSSLLVKLHLHHSRQNTSKLRQTLSKKLKAHHPIHSMLKQTLCVDLRRILEVIGLEITFTHKYDATRMRQNIATFFFTKYPNNPLTSL